MVPIKTIADVKRCIFFTIGGISDTTDWAVRCASGQTMPCFANWKCLSLRAPYIHPSDLQTFLGFAKEQKEPQELIDYIEARLKEKST